MHDSLFPSEETAPVTEIDVLVVGAGQAGIAMSEHLTRAGLTHVVLERDRVAESWRSRRWDSLVANGPVWHDRFPGLAFDGRGDDEFATKDEVARYFERYAEQIGAPLRCGTEVLSVVRREQQPGFHVHTSAGSLIARHVVAATGAFQEAVIPELIDDSVALAQLHSSQYRNPGELAPGAVLVVGAGSSGVQIAAELQRSGRQVYLAVGPHERPPRRYRGRDFVWWLGVLGKWDAAAPDRGAEHVTIAVSGADGGRTVDFRELAAEGIVLVGRLTAVDDGVARFAPDLCDNVARGDASHLALLDEADEYIRRNGLDLPPDDEARQQRPDPACLRDPLAELDLVQAGVGTVIWATGFRSDYRWLPDGAVDAEGRPRHHRGVSPEAGIYFLGLPWQSRRGSSFIWGVWHDAAHVAEQIGIQQGYLRHSAVASVAAESEQHSNNTRLEYQP